MSVREQRPYELVSSDRMSFEACSQLVSCMRYQLSDPHEFLNKCSFPTTAYFAFVESNREYYRSHKEGSSWRHCIHFAWVIKNYCFSRTAEVAEPQVISPVITVDGCQRKWHLTIRPFTLPTPVQQEVYLTCNSCKDVSISARMEMDLHLGPEKIGNDAVTNVKFDWRVDRHLVFTGPVEQHLWRDRNEDLLKAYTIQGIFNVADCCDELQGYLPDL